MVRRNYCMKTIYFDEKENLITTHETPLTFGELLKKESELAHLGYVAYFDKDRETKDAYTATIDGYKIIVLFERVKPFAEGVYR